MPERAGWWLTGRRGARRPVRLACPARRPRFRRPGRGSDRGSSAIELVILAPALLLVSMMIIEFALWLDATHAALAAAQEGDRAARAAKQSSPSWEQTGTDVAMNYYHGLDTSVLANVSASKINYDAAANTVTLTVSGRLNGIFPLTITESASGPVECFRTAQSGGTSCG
jgi:Flp pilus assembly protein TadG